VNRPLPVVVSDVAKRQIRTAEDWWRVNRSKAPNAIREELERAASLIAIQPAIGSRATNVSLAGIRRLHLSRVRYYLYYWKRPDAEQIEILAFWHDSRGSGPAL
jgi:plasmid stabilization system protein ParE